jgi:hypothetical protein
MIVATVKVELNGLFAVPDHAPGSRSGIADVGMKSLERKY